MKINSFFAPDYAGIIQGMRFDKVDVAWYGNKSAMEAVDRAGGEIFAQTVAANGNPGYWSLLIAHKDSPINSVEDMLKNAKTLTFGNGDPHSTSGFLVPRSEERRVGKECGSTCRSRWSRDHYKTQQKTTIKK